MEAFSEILRVHAARYPLMAPVDAVKLSYQNAFGVGHLISDPAAHWARLHKERAEAVETPGAPLTERIGGGLVRVQLSALPEGASALLILHEACLATAKSFAGSRAAFMENLAAIRETAAAGALPFSAAEAETFLAGYRAAGYPLVSHSEAYRAAYHPAYRVALSKLLPGEWTG